MMKKHVLSKQECIDDTYTVKCLIGEGKGSEVYRVKHKYLGTQALKLWKGDDAKNIDLEGLAYEARNLAKLTHENVVRVFEVNQFSKNEEVHHFLTMGFVSGETLLQLLHRNVSLPATTAVSFIGDILAGLKMAHDQEPAIIHGDIRPSNILLNYEGDSVVAMLSDFRLARAEKINPLDRHRKSEAIEYMPPETLEGVSEIGSDIFAVGVLLYKILTGVSPWNSHQDRPLAVLDGIEASIARRAQRRPKPPSAGNLSCDETLDRIVMTALNADPDDRYSDVSEFLDALNSRSERGYQRGSGTSSSGSVDSKKAQSSRHGGKKENRGGFKDIGGMLKLKKTLHQDVILPWQEKELYELYKVTIPNGMLLYGPPGCGKTFIARKLADELNFTFEEVKPSDLGSIYVHGGKKKIGQLFDWARENAPVVLFLDEIDAIVPNRDDQVDSHYASEVNEVLTQMNECAKDDVFIIAATNRPGRIDPAVLRTGRIDKIVFVNVPDLDARSDIFKVHLLDRPVDEDVDLMELAEMTDNYAASDIEFIVNEAARKALADKTWISSEHLKNTIKTNLPSITLEQINEYEQFSYMRSFV